MRKDRWLIEALGRSRKQAYGRFLTGVESVSSWDLGKILPFSRHGTWKMEPVEVFIMELDSSRWSPVGK